MLTEQEVLATINQKIKDKQLSPATAKYVEKMKILQNLLETHQNSANDLKKKVLEEESEIQRLKGAISMLLELSAEEEGLIKQEQNQVK